MADVNEKYGAFGEKGSFKPDGGLDVERRGSRRGSTTINGRKMSRIGPPPNTPGSIVAGDSDEEVEHARLLALEADNAIQYRTCSWQKVRIIQQDHRIRR